MRNLRNNDNTLGTISITLGNDYCKHYVDGPVIDHNNVDFEYFIVIIDTIIEFRSFEHENMKLLTTTFL